MIYFNTLKEMVYLGYYFLLILKRPLTRSDTFLFAVLKSFGFGPQFIQWVRTFLNNAESCVVNNGLSTGYFPLETGTRQGDPLSAYLFILCVESLFIQIREDENIKGIVIGDHEIKLSAYAVMQTF